MQLSVRLLEEYNTCLTYSLTKIFVTKSTLTLMHNGNGYPLDCHGWNITGKTNPKTDLEGNGNVNDNNGHGTHVSGIIGAQKKMELGSVALFRMSLSYQFK
jgi:subtilisin family serine protease